MRLLLSITLLIISLSLFACTKAQPEGSDWFSMDTYPKNHNFTLKDSLKYRLNINPSNLDSVVFTNAHIYKGYDDFLLDPFLWVFLDDSGNDTLAIRYNWGLYNPEFRVQQNKDLLYRLSHSKQKFLYKYDSIKKDILKNTNVKLIEEYDYSTEGIMISKISNYQSDNLFVVLSIKFYDQIYPFVDYDHSSLDYHIQVDIIYKSIDNK